MINFEIYHPQKIFLVQGDEELYASILNTSKEKFTLVHSLVVARFTMENARNAARFAIEGDGTQRMLVVYFSVFSPDAAQLLLKSLEEPDLYTTIVFVTPYPYIVPMTIRSRVMLIESENKEKIVMKITKESAMAFVKNELSTESDEDAATRRAKAISFLDDLEYLCKDNPHKARTVYEAKHMLLRANIPTKYVVEYAVAALF